MKSVSIIIPCYNEEACLPQLFTKLNKFNERVKTNYKLNFYFIDDGSTDDTLLHLGTYTNRFSNFHILRHKKNRNLGAALKTGILEAKNADYLGFLDSDCTYEPEIMISLLKKLDQGYDLATVSPYHPQGIVEGVPKWRLFLSQSSSLIYRILLNKKLYTYTAMVRAVKTEKVRKLVNRKNDFSFVAEFMIRAVLNSYSISEVPAALKVRKFGVSKMNTLKTIRSHLLIIKDLLLNKIT